MYSHQQKKHYFERVFKIGSKIRKPSHQQEGRHVDFEKALFTWFPQKWAGALPISGDMLKAKAIDLTKIITSLLS